jgi:Secretion system C-terminal sorting domain
MKTYKKLFLILCVLGSSLKGYTQTTSIGFDSLFPVFFPQSVVQDSSVAFLTLKLKNYGTNSFTASLGSPIKIMTQVYQNGFAVSLDTTNNVIQQAVLLPDSTILYNYFEPYDANRFPVGIDVVVIWPKIVGAPIFNTINYTVQVSAQVGVSELLIEDGIKVFPNPCSDLLSIENRVSNNPIEQVRIYDLKGKLLLSKSRYQTIDLTQLPNATYVLDLVLKSGDRKVMRFQKQD